MSGGFFLSTIDWPGLFYVVLSAHKDMQEKLPCCIPQEQQQQRRFDRIGHYRTRRVGLLGKCRTSVGYPQQ